MIRREFPTEAVRAASCAAWIGISLVMSLRFLTSQSQTLEFLNPAKPGLLALWILLTALLAYSILRPADWQMKAAGSPLLTAALLGGLLAAVFILFPLLDRDSVKVAGEGSDADDALIEAARRLASGESPYAATTYRGNQISPGIGWVALNLLFGSRATFFALTPFYMACLALMLWKSEGTWVAANIALLCHFASLGFWELAPTHDIVAFSAALGATFVAACAARESSVMLGMVGVIMGTVASARLPFAVFPLLAAALLWRLTARRSVVLCLAGTVVVAGWHLGAMLLDPTPYQPLHLIGRGGALLTGGWGYLIAPAMIVAGIAILLYPARTASGAAFRCGLCMAVPLGTLAAAQLADTGFDLGRWEGINYLAPALTLFVVALAAGRSPRSSGLRPGLQQAVI